MIKKEDATSKTSNKTKQHNRPTEATCSNDNRNSSFQSISSAFQPSSLGSATKSNTNNNQPTTISPSPSPSPASQQQQHPSDQQSADKWSARRSFLFRSLVPDSNLSSSVPTATTNSKELSNSSSKLFQSPSPVQKQQSTISKSSSGGLSHQSSRSSGSSATSSAASLLQLKLQQLQQQQQQQQQQQSGDRTSQSRVSSVSSVVGLPSGSTQPRVTVEEQDDPSDALSRSSSLSVTNRVKAPSSLSRFKFSSGRNWRKSSSASNNQKQKNVSSNSHLPHQHVDTPTASPLSSSSSSSTTSAHHLSYSSPGSGSKSRSIASLAAETRLVAEQITRLPALATANSPTNNLASISSSINHEPNSIQATTSAGISTMTNHNINQRQLPLSSSVTDGHITRSNSSTVNQQQQQQQQQQRPLVGLGSTYTKSAASGRLPNANIISASNQPISINESHADEANRRRNQTTSTVQQAGAPFASKLVNQIDSNLSSQQQQQRQGLKGAPSGDSSASALLLLRSSSTTSSSSTNNSSASNLNSSATTGSNNLAGGSGTSHHQSHQAITNVTATTTVGASGTHSSSSPSSSSRSSSASAVASAATGTQINKEQQEKEQPHNQNHHHRHRSMAASNSASANKQSRRKKRLSADETTKQVVVASLNALQQASPAGASQQPPLRGQSEEPGSSRRPPINHRSRLARRGSNSNSNELSESELEVSQDESGPKMGMVTGIFFKVWSLVKVAKSRRHRNQSRQSEPDTASNFEYYSGEQAASQHQYPAGYRQQQSHSDKGSQLTLSSGAIAINQASGNDKNNSHNNKMIRHAMPNAAGHYGPMSKSQSSQRFSQYQQHENDQNITANYYVNQQANNNNTKSKGNKKCLVKKSATTTLNGHELASSHSNRMLPSSAIIKLTNSGNSSLGGVSPRMSSMEQMAASIAATNQSSGDKSQQVGICNSMGEQLTVSQVYSVPLDSKPVVTTDQAGKLYPITKSFSTNNFYHYQQQQQSRAPQISMQHHLGGASGIDFQPKPIIINHHGQHQFHAINHYPDSSLSIHPEASGNLLPHHRGAAGSRSMLSTQSSLSTGGDSSSISSSTSAALATTTTIENQLMRQQHQQQQSSTDDGLLLGGQQHHPLHIKSGIHYHAPRPANEHQAFFYTGAQYTGGPSLPPNHSISQPIERPNSLMLHDFTGVGSIGGHTPVAGDGSWIMAPAGGGSITPGPFNSNYQASLMGPHYPALFSPSQQSQTNQQYTVAMNHPYHLYNQPIHQSAAYEQQQQQQQQLNGLNRQRSTFLKDVPPSSYFWPNYNNNGGPMVLSSPAMLPDNSAYLFQYNRHQRMGATPQSLFVSSPMMTPGGPSVQRRGLLTGGAGGYGNSSSNKSGFKMSSSVSMNSFQPIGGRNEPPMSCSSLAGSKQTILIPELLEGPNDENSDRRKPRFGARKPGNLRGAGSGYTNQQGLLMNELLLIHKINQSFMGDPFLELIKPLIPIERPLPLESTIEGQLLTTAAGNGNMQVRAPSTVQLDVTSHHQHPGDIFTQIKFYVHSPMPTMEASNWINQEANGGYQKPYSNRHQSVMDNQKQLQQPVIRVTQHNQHNIGQHHHRQRFLSQSEGKLSPKKRQEELNAIPAPMEADQASLLRLKRRPRLSRKLYKMIKSLMRVELALLNKGGHNNNDATTATITTRSRPSHDQQLIYHHIVISGATGTGKTLFVNNLVENGRLYQQQQHQQHLDALQHLDNQNGFCGQPINMDHNRTINNTSQMFPLEQSDSIAGFVSHHHNHLQRSHQNFKETADLKAYFAPASASSSLKSDYQIKKAENILSSHLLAHHYCQAHDYATKNTIDFIQNLLYQIVNNNCFYAFRELLTGPGEQACRYRRLLSRSSCLKEPLKALKEGLFMPLEQLWSEGRIIVPRSGMPFLVVVDALDEACRSSACPNHPQPSDGPTRIDTGSCHSSACSDDDTFTTPPVNQPELEEVKKLIRGSGLTSSSSSSSVASGSRSSSTGSSSLSLSLSSNKQQQQVPPPGVIPIILTKCDNPIGKLLADLVPICPYWIKFIITINSSHLCYNTAANGVDNEAASETNSNATSINSVSSSTFSYEPKHLYELEAKNNLRNKNNNSNKNHRRKASNFTSKSIITSANTKPDHHRKSNHRSRHGAICQQQPVVVWKYLSLDANIIRKGSSSSSYHHHNHHHNSNGLPSSLSKAAGLAEAEALSPGACPSSPLLQRDLDLLAYIQARTKVWSPALFERLTTQTDHQISRGEGTNPTIIGASVTIHSSANQPLDRNKTAVSSGDENISKSQRGVSNKNTALKAARQKISPRRRAIRTLINYLATHAHGSFLYCDLLLEMIESKKILFDYGSSPVEAATSNINEEAGRSSYGNGGSCLSRSSTSNSSSSNITESTTDHHHQNHPSLPLCHRPIIMRLDKQFGQSISRSGWHYLFRHKMGPLAPLLVRASTATATNTTTSTFTNAGSNGPNTTGQPQQPAAGGLKPMDVLEELDLDQLFYLYMEFKFPQIRSRWFADQATFIVQILMAATCTCSSTPLNQTDLFMALNAGQSSATTSSSSPNSSILDPAASHPSGTSKTASSTNAAPSQLQPQPPSSSSSSSSSSTTTTTTATTTAAISSSAHETIKRWKAFEVTLNELSCAHLIKLQCNSPPPPPQSPPLIPGGTLGASPSPTSSDVAPQELDGVERLTKGLCFMFKHDSLRQWLSNCHPSVIGTPGSGRPLILSHQYNHRFSCDTTYGHYCLAKWLLMPSLMLPTNKQHLQSNHHHQFQQSEGASVNTTTGTNTVTSSIKGAHDLDYGDQVDDSERQLFQDMDPSLVTLLIKRRLASSSEYNSSSTSSSHYQQTLTPHKCLQIAAHAVHCFVSSCRRRRSSSTTSFNWTLNNIQPMGTGSNMPVISSGVGGGQQFVGSGGGRDNRATSIRSIDSGISQVAFTNTMSSTVLPSDPTIAGVGSPGLLSIQQQMPDPTTGTPDESIGGHTPPLSQQVSSAAAPPIPPPLSIQNRRRSSIGNLQQQQQQLISSSSAANGVTGGSTSSQLDPLASPWFDELLGILCDQDESLLSSALCLPVNLFDSQLEASRLLLSAGANANVTVVSVGCSLYPANSWDNQHQQQQQQLQQKQYRFPLILMMTEKNDLEFVKLLLQFQADPDHCALNPHIEFTQPITNNQQLLNGAEFAEDTDNFVEDDEHRQNSLLIMNPSVVAAHRGYTEILKLLVEHGASDRITPRYAKILKASARRLNDKLFGYYHPLLVATCFEHKEIVEYLIDHLHYVYCVSINSGHQEEFFLKLLHQSIVIACLRGNQQIFDTLIRFLRFSLKQSKSNNNNITNRMNDLINKRDDELIGHSPLTAAASNQNLRICHQLVDELAAKIDCLDATNRTPLACLLATMHPVNGNKLKNHSEVMVTIQLLMKSTESPIIAEDTTCEEPSQLNKNLLDHQDKPFGFTALIHAARILPTVTRAKSSHNRRGEIIIDQSLVVERQESLESNGISTDDSSDLETSSSCNEAASLSGASAPSAVASNCPATFKNASNITGDSSHETTKICENLSSKIVKLLIKNGANINLTDIQGSTALMHAIQCDNFKSVQYLIESQQVDVNARNELGMSAVDYACLHGRRIKMLRMLIDNGANFEYKDNNGLRILDRVIAEYSPDTMVIIEYLLQNGAKLGSKTWEMANGKMDVLDVLLRKLCQDGYYLYKKMQIDAAVYRFEYALKRLAVIEHRQAPLSKLKEGKRFVPMDPHYLHYNHNQLLDETVLESMQQTKYQLYLGLSRCERKRKNYMKALEDAHMTILIESSSYEGYFSKAQILKDLGENHDALVAVEQASNLIDKTIAEIMSELNRIVPGHRRSKKSVCETQMTENAEYLIQARRYVHNLRSEILFAKHASSSSHQLTAGTTGNISTRPGIHSMSDSFKDK